MNILVTGGAGFIGSHLVEELLRRGHNVRVLDSFVKQAHRDGLPRLDGSSADVIIGDVCDAGAVDDALHEIEVVYHLAAEVGVGQSMYEIDRYVSANTRGTAVLLEGMAPYRAQFKKLIVASSMSVYGDGAYDRNGVSIPTPESKPLKPASVYAITKQDQEQLCLTVGRSWGLPTIALRYFNVYGAGQSLANPYTGVAAIFAAALLAGKSPVVYDDGNQTRDFVHVSDIVRANVLALEMESAKDCAINIGTGHSTSIRQLALLLAERLGSELKPEITGQHRDGDIRHCIADISLARRLLGYRPLVSIESGVVTMLEWARERV